MLSRTHTSVIRRELIKNRFKTFRTGIGRYTRPAMRECALFTRTIGVISVPSGYTVTYAVILSSRIIVVHIQRAETRSCGYVH